MVALIGKGGPVSQVQSWQIDDDECSQVQDDLTRFKAIREVIDKAEENSTGFLGRPLEYQELEKRY